MECRAVDGLDCVAIGANDLTGSMGIPYMGQSTQAQDAIDKILAAAKRHGKYTLFSTRNMLMAVR